MNTEMNAASAKKTSDRKYYLRNRDRIKAQVKSWRTAAIAADPDYNKKRYSKTRDKSIARSRAYRLGPNREKILATDRARYWRDKPKRKLANRARYFRNHEQNLIKGRESYALNREKRREYSKSKRLNRPEVVRKYRLEYYSKNKSRLADHWKAKRAARKAEKAAYDREYAKVNAAKKQAYLKQWYQANKANQNSYCRTRRTFSPQYRVSNNLRCRMNTALRNVGVKRDRPLEVLIGCTVVDLVSHLESLFQPGMTWENRSQWHIDHKIPCAAFDLTDPAQQLKCFHFSNLQPLWKADNLKKGARVVGEQRMAA